MGQFGRHIRHIRHIARSTQTAQAAHDTHDTHDQDDALHTAFTGMVQSTIADYQRVHGELTAKIVVIQAAPNDMALRAQIAQLFGQLCEARGKAVAWLDAFALACPTCSLETHAALGVAVGMAIGDATMPSVGEILRNVDMLQRLAEAQTEAQAEGGV